MSQTLNTLLGVVGGIATALGLIWGGIATLRGGRATAERSVADIQRGLIEDLRTQQDRDRADANQRITALEHDLTQEREHSALQDRALSETQTQLERLRVAIRRHVLPLVNWLDSGAQPPPPRISDELRALLDD